MTTTSTTVTLLGHLEMSEIIEEIETATGVTLMSRTPDDVINGYVNLVHSYNEENDPISLVQVHLYNEDEPPTEDEPEMKSGSIRTVIYSATEGLAPEIRDQVREDLLPITTGHTTDFVAPADKETKLNAFAEWAANRDVVS